MKILSWLSVFILCLSVTTSLAAKYRELDTKQVKAMMDAGGVLVVNPMTPIEHAIEHIAGTVNIPIENLKKGLPADKNQPLVFYCLGEKCVYSWRAAEDAADLGYQNVYAYRGGIPAWKSAGYPTASTEKISDLNAPSVSTEQLAQKLKSDDFVLVDINAQEDTDKFWVDTPKRFHIPLIDFDQKYKSLPKDKELVLLCLKGQRSAAVARFLVAKGYKDVKFVEGGVQKWVLEGRPVKKK